MIHATTDRVRRKAVWGSRFLLPLLLVLIGITSDAAASGRHTRQGPKARAGVPNAQAKDYRLDHELSERANSGNTTRTSRVIVTLVPGATLPAEFARYASKVQGGLDIINGQVLELPNAVLRQLA